MKGKSVNVHYSSIWAPEKKVAFAEDAIWHVRKDLERVKKIQNTYSSNYDLAGYANNVLRSIGRANRYSEQNFVVTV